MKAKEGLLAICPNSSHMPFWEERNAFMKRVGRFLAHVERGS